VRPGGVAQVVCGVTAGLERLGNASSGLLPQEVNSIIQEYTNTCAILQYKVLQLKPFLWVILRDVHQYLYKMQFINR
jgi:hypothetical protein